MAVDPLPSYPMVAERFSELLKKLKFDKRWVRLLKALKLLLLLAPALEFVLVELLEFLLL